MARRGMVLRRRTGPAPRSGRGSGHGRASRGE
uniref:Uncharacterized protein n=1 Tax=Arundo donax TaxID=35708 RepID=A0A0A8Y8X0_ARUDO